MGGTPNRGRVLPKTKDRPGPRASRARPIQPPAPADSRGGSPRWVVPSSSSSVFGNRHHPSPEPTQDPGALPVLAASSASGNSPPFLPQMPCSSLGQSHWLSSLRNSLKILPLKISLLGTTLILPPHCSLCLSRPSLETRVDERRLALHPSMPSSNLHPIYKTGGVVTCHCVSRGLPRA